METPRTVASDPASPCCRRTPACDLGAGSRPPTGNGGHSAVCARAPPLAHCMERRSALTALQAPDLAWPPSGAAGSRPRVRGRKLNDAKLGYASFLSAWLTYDLTVGSGRGLPGTSPHGEDMAEAGQPVTLRMLSSRASATRLLPHLRLRQARRLRSQPKSRARHPGGLPGRGWARLHAQAAPGPQTVRWAAPSRPRTPVFGGRMLQPIRALPTGTDIQLRMDGQVAENRGARRTEVRYSGPAQPLLPASLAATVSCQCRPAHYLEQFHVKYAEPAELEKAGRGRRANWAQLFLRKDPLNDFDDPANPTLQPWMQTTLSPAQPLRRLAQSRFPPGRRTGRRCPTSNRVSRSSMAG